MGSDIPVRVFFKIMFLPNGLNHSVGCLTCFSIRSVEFGRFRLPWYLWSLLTYVKTFMCISTKALLPPKGDASQPQRIVQHRRLVKASSWLTHESMTRQHFYKALGWIYTFLCEYSCSPADQPLSQSVNQDIFVDMQSSPSIHNRLFSLKPQLSSCFSHTYFHNWFGYREPPNRCQHAERTTSS